MSVHIHTLIYTLDSLFICRCLMVSGNDESIQSNVHQQINPGFVKWRHQLEMEMEMGMEMGEMEMEMGMEMVRLLHEGMCFCMGNCSVLSLRVLELLRLEHR